MQLLYNNLLYFLLYAVAATCFYWGVPKRFRSFVLLLSNILFYGLCAGWYIVLVLAAGLWSFYCAKQISYLEGKRRWLICAIIPLVTLLCFFKYWTPTQSVIGKLLYETEDFSALQLVLPLGMSYYILKSISYLVDVYKQKIKYEKNIVDYLSYVSFYGQIVSGPIQRYEQWRTECRKDNPTKSWINGYYLIVLGLFMKLVIANRLSDYVNLTFAAPETANGIQLWLCFFLYAIYIYCDFAGYSYIAIGITNSHGIECIQNFDRPYFSKDIREFWNRWHISLSTWLRDYIYIPLGGNRKGPMRRVVNVMITFLVCGIWHGSTMNFVVWGGYHGIANVLTSKKSGGGKFLIRVIQSLWTFLIVAAGWVFFASNDLSSALEFFRGMFVRLSFDMVSIQNAILPIHGDVESVSFLIIALFFVLVLFLKETNDFYRFIPRTKTLSFIWQVFLLTSIMLFGVFGSNSFIYAGF